MADMQPSKNGISWPQVAVICTILGAVIGLSNWLGGSPAEAKNEAVAHERRLTTLEMAVDNNTKSVDKLAAELSKLNDRAVALVGALGIEDPVEDP